MKQSKSLYSLITLEDFKALLCIDDREDALARYCLTIATHTIERYCMRRLLRKKHFELMDYTEELLLPLREYPVIKVLAAYTKGEEKVIEPELYYVVPECGSDEDWPYSLYLSPTIRRYYPAVTALRVIYWAGYTKGKMPHDLRSACLELAAWNMGRYKGRRIGMTGNIRKDGEHFEINMPENVKALIEPYRRRVI